MKNKGFTLIELLAVIVILAIIALIATPVILNIIDDTKQESVNRSKDNYLHAAEIAVANYLINYPEVDLSNVTCDVEPGGNLNCGDGIEIPVNIDGTKPTGGRIVFENGKISEESSVEIDGTGGSAGSGDSIICRITQENGVEGINIGDEVTCGTESFYVIPNDSSAHLTATGENITLLAKYNLNIGDYIAPGPTGIQNSQSIGENSDLSSCNYTSEERTEYLRSTGGNYGGFTALGKRCTGTVVFSSAAYWSPNLYVYNDKSTLYNYVEDYKIYLSGLGIDVKEASIPTKTQFEEFNSSARKPSDFVITSFWLGNSSSSMPGIYYVSYTNTIGNIFYNVGYTAGVRPVITLPTANIQK